VGLNWIVQETRPDPLAYSSLDVVPPSGTQGTYCLIYGRADWRGVSGIGNPVVCHGQVPGHFCLSGHICKKCCWDANRVRYETAKTTVVSLSGMIRFVKTAFFSGGQQLFFIRKMVTAGIFSC
jgi:hypothetical protein